LNKFQFEFELNLIVLPSSLGIYNCKTFIGAGIDPVKLPPIYAHVRSCWEICWSQHNFMLTPKILIYQL